MPSLASIAANMKESDLEVSVRAHLTILAATIAMLASVPAVAHHSFAAEYDASKKIELTGVGDEIRVDQSARPLLSRRDRP